MTTGIARTNSRDGVAEHPWRDGQDRYVLGDPAHGGQKHLARYELKVRTPGEVLALIARSLPVRMARDGKQTLLISRGSLAIRRD